MIVNVAVWLGLCELIRFHIYITILGISTLEYLKRKDEKMLNRSSKIKIRKVQPAEDNRMQGAQLEIQPEI